MQEIILCGLSLTELQQNNFNLKQWFDNFQKWFRKHIIWQPLFYDHCCSNFITVTNCGEPPSVSNAMADAPSQFYEDVASYTCNTGYESASPTNVTCQAYGRQSLIVQVRKQV